MGKRVLVKNFAVGGSKSLLGVITRRRGPVAVEVKLEDLHAKALRPHPC